MLGCRPFLASRSPPIPSTTTAKRKAKTTAGSAATKAKTDPAKRDRNRLSAEAKLAELKRRLLEIADLSGAGAVLGWDQATYMPKGGAVARARQGATLSRLAHEKFTDPALGKLLDDLAPHAERLPYGSDDASLIRIVRRDFDKATKVPADALAKSLAGTTAETRSFDLPLGSMGAPSPVNEPRRPHRECRPGKGCDRVRR